MDLRMAAALIVPLISTAITLNKIIAGVVVLVIIVAAVVWWMSRRRGSPRA
jgi:heme/copper-type cytochrome/quinol oxidase subunit 4